MISWKELFGIKDASGPEMAKEWMDAKGNWDTNYSKFSVWDKTIKLAEMYGYQYWLCLNKNRNWILYRSKVE